MNYINLSKKHLVGRNNQTLTQQLSLDYHTSESIDFTFINDKNQILDVPQGNYSFAGAIITSRKEN